MVFVGLFSFLALLFFTVMVIVPPLRQKISPNFTLKKSLLFGLIAFIIMVVAALNTDSSDDKKSIATDNDNKADVGATLQTSKTEPTTEPTIEPTQEPVKEETVREEGDKKATFFSVVPTPTPKPVIESTPEPVKETAGQRNAVTTAKNYLKFMAFSRDGLITQLEFEGYSNEDAVYGTDQSGADWNEQAVIKAQNYLDLSAFSKSALIDQLKFEGFTSEQAEHGANEVYE